MKELNQESFAQEIESGKTLVDFWAPWCGPCRSQTPILEEFQKTTDIKICKVNVDEEPDIARNFGVMSIPTLILFEAGKMIKKEVGLHDMAALEEFIR